MPLVEGGQAPTDRACGGVRSDTVMNDGIIPAEELVRMRKDQQVPQSALVSAGALLMRRNS